MTAAAAVSVHHPALAQARSAGFHPDGKRLVVYTRSPDDRWTVRRLEFATDDGRVLRDTLIGPLVCTEIPKHLLGADETGVQSIHPAPDGNTLTLEYPGGLVAWWVDNDKPSFLFFREKAFPERCRIGHSPEGGLLYLAQGKNVTLMHAMTGRVYNQGMIPFTSQILFIVWATTGDQLRVGTTGEAGTLEIWSVLPGGSHHRSQTIVWPSHLDVWRINDAVFTKNGRYAAFLETRALSIWNMHDGRLLQTIAVEPTCESLEFSPWNYQLAISDWRAGASWWSTTTGKRCSNAPPLAEAVWTTYSPIGDLVAAGTRDGTLMIVPAPE